MSAIEDAVSALIAERLATVEQILRNHFKDLTVLGSRVRALEGKDTPTIIHDPSSPAPTALRWCPYCGARALTCFRRPTDAWALARCDTCHRTFWADEKTEGPDATAETESSRPEKLSPVRWCPFCGCTFGPVWFLGESAQCDTCHHAFVVDQKVEHDRRR